MNNVVTRRFRSDGGATPRPRLTKYGRRRFRGESGFILVMTGLLIIPLIAFTAFAVDVGSWYAQAAKMQRAADDAALAGVIWNGNSTTQNTTVQAIAAKNGFVNGTGGVTVTAAIPPGNGTQLTVTISAPGSLFFGGLFLPNEILTRSATAQYNQPIPMGSPLGQLGNDPDQLDTADFGASGEPGHWLDVTGWDTPKSEGNQFTSGNCTIAVTSEWNCSGSGQGSPTPPPGPNNGDFTNQGYTYAVHYDGSQPGPLNIAIYDPAMTQQNNDCSQGGTPADGLPTATELATLTTFFSSDPNASTRYAAANNQYCAGDTAEMPTSVTPDLTTSYVVRAPVAGKPQADLTNPAVCGITFSPHGGNGFDLANALMNPANQGLENMPLSAEYHKYVTICTIATPVVGDYLLQIRTNAPVPSMAPVTTATTNSGTQTTIDTDLGVFNPNPVAGHGHNRYAIEAYYGSNPNVRTSRAGVSVAAGGKLPMYVNLGTTTPISTTTQFYLARVGSQYKGSTLQLNLWDIGDGSNGAIASITIQPPVDGSGAAATCNWFRDVNGSEVPLATAGTAASISGAGNCTLSNLTSADFNDRLIQLEIPLPGDYSCHDAVNADCWWTMGYSFPAGNPDDTTTWQAKILGNPVHLTQ